MAKKLDVDSGAAQLASHIINHRAKLLAALRSIESLVNFDYANSKGSILKIITNVREQTVLPSMEKEQER